MSLRAFHHPLGSDEGPDFELINKEVFGGRQEIIIECFAPLAPSADQVSAKPETEVTAVEDKCESVIHNGPLMAWCSAQPRTIFHRVFEMLEHAVAMSDSPSSTKCKEFFATVYEVVIGICPSEDLKKEPGFRKIFFFNLLTFTCLSS